ncbi:MAG: hypothetical protein Q7J24_16560 [Desulfomicrobium sp.]|nr:hypothetical protein [Desulfomicrobium sp.]
MRPEKFDGPTLSDLMAMLAHKVALVCKRTRSDAGSGRTEQEAASG